MCKEKNRPWNYLQKRSQSNDGKIVVSLMPPWSNDTRTTVKDEYKTLFLEVERAATVILQNPDVKVTDIAAEFPEIRKRCGEDRIQTLLNGASSNERRFSVAQFCLETLHEVSRYPQATLKSYLYTPSRQKQQSFPGRPPKNK